MERSAFRAAVTDGARQGQRLCLRVERFGRFASLFPKHAEALQQNGLCSAVADFFT